MANGKSQLTLRPETAFFVLLKAREFHAKVEDVDPDEGSNPTDDDDIDVLEFNPGDAVEEELFSAVSSLNEDERLDLIALVWIGRGDFAFSNWQEARENARRIDPTQVAVYLLEHPLVSTYLEDALAQLGFHLSSYLDGSLAEPLASAAVKETYSRASATAD